MKIAILIYHDILEDRIDKLLENLKIDYFTEWENVKGRGHLTDPHLGTRTFPGFNTVRMIAFQDENILTELQSEIIELNKDAYREDDKIRLFQLPLEKIV